MSEVYEPRQVTALVCPHLHREGHSATNFIHDAEVMLEQGEHYGMTEGDFRFLIHALKCCIKPSSDTPDGHVVSLSSRQFGAFVAMRRAFLRDRHRTTNLASHLQSKFRVTTADTSEINP